MITHGYAAMYALCLTGGPPYLDVLFVAPCRSRLGCFLSLASHVLLPAGCRLLLGRSVGDCVCIFINVLLHVGVLFCV